jgi:hypothetical protein
MAYVFDLERDFDPQPYVDAFGSHMIDFALGYDPASALIVLMSVMLILDESGAHELCFGVRTRDARRAADASPPDYSSSTAAKFVPSPSRPEVMMMVLEAIRSLVESAKPQDIIMETFHSDLPPKAMKKYERIGAVLEGLSYTMTEQFRDEEDGKDYWAFTRNV